MQNKVCRIAAWVCMVIGFGVMILGLDGSFKYYMWGADFVGMAGLIMGYACMWYANKTGHAKDNLSEIGFTH